MTVSENKKNINSILIPKEELILKYSYKLPEKSYAYKESEDPIIWQDKCLSKLQELIASDFNIEDRTYETHHTTITDFGTVNSLIMHINKNLSLPGYLLLPKIVKHEMPVIAVQGHAYDVRGILGIKDDYHHGFGKELCLAGFVTLVPELRGFGTIVNLAADDGRKLIYYNWGELMAYTLVTDAFIKGYTLVGDTINDLYAWGTYLLNYTKKKNYSVAGISYGGDLALILAALDKKIEKTFASGTLGSMEPIFETCYNAPAHCIPNILKYMDRQEIASCIAPRSLAVHYGELDKPSPQNSSAANNETAIIVYNKVKHFYEKLNGEDNIKLIITPNIKHEMDNNALINYMGNIN
jgi:cephalosporin-C deacetylase-like acetyl esterase